MKETTDSKSESGDNARGGKQFLKEKGNKKNPRKENNFAAEHFRGVGFHTRKEGPELYSRTIERLGLYVSTCFKNGSNMKKCHMKEKLVKPAIPVLADNHTVHKKRVWDHRIQGILKTEQMLDSILCNLFAVLMSLCDSETKRQLESMAEYKALEEDLDTIGLLKAIKRLVYMGGMNKLNPRHNRAMAHMNLMNLLQEKFQDIQEFRDQYKVCNELGLCFGRCENDAKAVLSKKGVTDPTQEQLNKELDIMEQEHHAIIFMYKVDKYKYGKLLEQMENDMVQKKKDPFPKTIGKACDILAGWKN